MHTHKCPKCEKTLTHLDGQSIDIHVGGKNAWKGATFACPWCKSVLSAGIDPIAMKNDIVNSLKKR